MNLKMQYIIARLHTEGRVTSYDNRKIILVPALERARNGGLAHERFA